MADNKVLLELEIVQKGSSLSIVQKQTEKLRKEQDKTSDSTKKLTKQQDMGYGRQKQGLVQTANSTKNFSKLANTIDGGGTTSLVGAYATLAANVFAASAAFNALARAASFQQLQQGLELIGNQSGRSLGVLTRNLREATGMALSLEAASRAAALGISGGFGEKELAGLAEIAKGASLALGRDLTDAFDRLTRGAIKLEPEILDELGIMVRLDDAVEQYAAALQKPASALSQLERRQAFMNAILEQGELKFGDIAKQVEPTPYQRLGAAFADLVKDIFSFFNETLQLNKIIGFLADNTLALTGVMIAFGSTIATQMIPALGQIGAGARAAAVESAAMAKELSDASVTQLAAARQSVATFSGGTATFKNLQVAIGKGVNDTQNLDKALRTLQNSEKRRSKNLLAGSVKNRAQKKVELEQIRAQIRLVKELQLAEQNQSSSQLVATRAQIAANFQETQAEVVERLSNKELGLAGAIAASNAAIDVKFKQLGKLGKSSTKTTGIIAALSGANLFLSKTFAKAAASARLFGIALLQFLPLIGAVLVVAGLVGFALFKAFNTDEVVAYKKSLKDLNEILEGLPGKAKEYQKSLQSLANPAQVQIRQFEIIGNSVTEVNDKLRETLKLRKEAGKEANIGLTSQETNQIFSSEEKKLELLKTQSAGIIENFSGDSTTALKNIFAVNQTEEFKSFKALLETDIPAITEAVKNNTKDTFEKLLKVDPNDKKALREILTELAEDVDIAAKRFRGLSDGVKTLSNELKNVEKVASSFTQKFFPKTSATDIINSFNSISKTVSKVTEDAIQAGEESTLAIGKALSEAGPNLRKLVGGDFAATISELNKIQGQIRKAAEKRGENSQKTEAEENLIRKQKELQLKLGKEGNVAFEDTLKILKEIQEAEVTRKSVLKGIADSKKVIQKATKITAEATRVSLSFDKIKLKFERDIVAEQLKIIANSQNINRAGLTENELVEALLKKRDELAKTKGKEEEAVAITLKLQERQNIITQQLIQEATREFKVQQSLLGIQKDRLAQEQKLLSLRQTLEGNRTSREFARFGLETPAFVAAKEQRKFEEQKLEIARKRIALEKSLLSIQNKILATEINVLGKRSAFAENQDESIKIAKGLVDELNLAESIQFDNLNSELILLSQTFSESFGDNLRNELKGIFTSSDFVNNLTSSLNIGARLGQISSERNDLSSERSAILDQTQSGLNSYIPGGNQAAVDTVRELTAEIDKLDDEKMVLMFQQSSLALMQFAEIIKEQFGEDGQVVASLANFSSTLASIPVQLEQGFKLIEGTDFDEEYQEKAAKTAVALSAVSSAISAFGQTLAADARSRTAEIDKQIEQEKKLDGKSKESVAKINALNKQKEQIERKQFEKNKKLQIANAIVSTASAAAQALAALGPIAGPILAGVITALGLAQVAIIKKQKYSGGSESLEAPNTALNIGSRSNAVDVSKGATGGELNYLRGGRTDGTNLGGAGAYLPGASMGRRGYADGGVVVGERGPEVITPSVPVDVTPNFALGGGSSNVNFTINAVDAAGVEDVLMNQRGNIIRMIREAANENGEDFLTQVDPMAYGSKR
tara:strand:- start:3992 stop:8710 length:4719 start_codon:yes stop_codon:yes gene_type:complete